MALLLAMYQKMKLIRQINQDTLKLTRISSKLDRVTKNIERTQKRYTSLFAQLDQQAKMMQSNATMFFQQFSGLGTNNFGGGFLNPQGFGGTNGFVLNIASGLLKNGIQLVKDGDAHTIDNNLFSDMMSHYMSNGGRFVPLKDPSDETKEYKVDGVLHYEGFTADDVKAFTMALQQGQMAQQQAQMWVQNANQQYGNNVSIWVEARRAELEAEQDAALEPLNYQDTMLQLEKEQLDARLQRLRQEKESYDTLVGEEAKNTAPSFGLR